MKRSPAFAAAAVGLSLIIARPTSLVAAAASIEDRLSQLQQQIEAVHTDNRAIREENRALKQKVERLEMENAAAKGAGVKPAMPPAITEAQFRASVAAVIKAERPAPFVLPAGKETVLKLGGLFQGNAEFGDVDAWNGRLPGGSDAGDDRFKIRRGRINVTGDYKDLFDFKAEGDFSQTDGSANRQNTFSTTDLFVNWRSFPEFMVKVGQFKVPFGMEQIAPTPGIYTAERSLVTQSLTPGRQVGAQVWGQPLHNVLDAPHDQLIEYWAGVFNGNGRNRGFNDNEQFMYVGRLQVNASKPYSPSYSDNEFSPTNNDVRLSVGLDGVLENQANRATPLVFHGDGGVLKGGPRTLSDGSLANSFTFGSDYRRVAWGADLAFRYGPFDLIAEYLEETFTPEATTTTDDQFKAAGFHVTGGYFLPVPGAPKKFQWIEKFEYYDPSNRIRHDAISTLTSGLNWYIKGDDIKLMLEWLHTWSDARKFLGRDAEFDLILSRLQLMF